MMAMVRYLRAEHILEIILVLNCRRPLWLRLLRLLHFGLLGFAEERHIVSGSLVTLLLPPERAPPHWRARAPALEGPWGTFHWRRAAGAAGLQTSWAGRQGQPGPG